MVVLEKNINILIEVYEVWSGLLDVLLSSAETFWCLCSQTMAHCLPTLASHWLMTLSVFHGWLAAVYLWKPVTMS